MRFPKVDRSHTLAVEADAHARKQTAPKTAIKESPLPSTRALMRAKDAASGALEAVALAAPPAYLVGGMTGALKMAGFVALFGAATGFAHAVQKEK